MNNERKIYPDLEGRLKKTIFRPIICVPMMLKIFTAQIKEEIYYSLVFHEPFPEEQKWCHEGQG